jgi:hypothetical protein
MVDRAKRWWDEECYVKYSGYLERLNMFFIILSFAMVIALTYWLFTTERIQASVSTKYFEEPSQEELELRKGKSKDEQIELELQDARKRLEIMRADREFNNSPGVSVIQSIRTACMIVPSLILCWEIFKRTTVHAKEFIESEARRSAQSGRPNLSRHGTISILAQMQATGLLPGSVELAS